MHHTHLYTLAQLELPVGTKGASVYLPGPAELRVGFTFHPGHSATPVLRNGDPGEPAMPAEFDFVSVENTHALALTSANGDLLQLVSPGSDLLELLSDADLDKIEQAMRQRIEYERGEARLETHLAMQEDGQ